MVLAKGQDDRLADHVMVAPPTKRLGRAGTVVARRGRILSRHTKL